ncbi:MAG: archease [Candidatus Omnitrophota bacterium]
MQNVRQEVVKKPYELIEHTADIGIRVRGRDLKSLFTNAASALFEIIAEEKPAPKKTLKKISLKQKSGDLEELFINWLNELLSLSSAKGIIFQRFKINKLKQDYLEAMVSGTSVINCRVNVEVKAATYHQLKIEKTKTGWQAEVIFDV